jgi:hypothetical protein
MSAVEQAITVKDVTQLHRVGVGPVYRAIVPIKTVYRLLKNSTVRYAPKYQRGFKQNLLSKIANSEWDRLFPINEPSLQVSHERAQEMAVKYLKAATGDSKTVLFSSNITWNARQEVDVPAPKFDPGTKTLSISTAITVPDTGHRHMAYYLIGYWKEHSNEVPAKVVVNDEAVSNEEILAMLKKVDLNDEKNHSIYVDIYCLSNEKEGWLYDEFNSDSKPPSRAIALDLNKAKTPSRRFMWALVAASPIFSDSEIETRSNTIAAQSRKLTTTSTLETAIKPFVKELLELEQEKAAGKSKAYDDVIAFFGEFYAEWATHFPGFLPGATFDQRKVLREETFAASNIMFFPMFRLAFDTWLDHRQKKVDWRKSTGWKTGLAKLAGTKEVKKKKVAIMSRENPDWQGKILIEGYSKNGEKTWSLSSTRQTREAAYNYLKEMFAN